MIISPKLGVLLQNHDNKHVMRFFRNLCLVYKGNRIYVTLVTQYYKFFISIIVKVKWLTKVSTIMLV